MTRRPMPRSSPRSRGALLLLGGIALLALPSFLYTEQLTMSTYYPSPYGVYSELRATTNSFLAYQGGAVGIGTKTPSADAKLHVVGTALLGKTSIGHMNPPDSRVALDVRGGNIIWGGDTITQVSALARDQGGSIELGGNDTGPGSGTPYIDFHHAGLTEDYNVRLINLTPNAIHIFAQGGQDAGFLGQMCKSVFYSYGTTTPCPNGGKGWSAIGASGAAGVIDYTLPPSGYMYCCKLQSY